MGVLYVVLYAQSAIKQHILPSFPHFVHRLLQNTLDLLVRSFCLSTGLGLWERMEGREDQNGVKLAEK